MQYYSLFAEYIANAINLILGFLSSYTTFLGQATILKS